MVMDRTPDKKKENLSQTIGEKARDLVTKTFTSKEDNANQGWKIANEKSTTQTGDMGKVWTQSNDTCTECNKKVKGKQMGVICDYCQVWFHNECVNIDKSEYKMLNAMEDKVKWYCKKCLVAVENYNKDNEELRMDNSNLKMQNEEMRAYITKMEEKMMKMEERLEHKLSRQLSKKLEEVVGKREKLILEKVEQAHLRYDEHHRAEIKQLGVDTVAEIRKLELKNKKQIEERDLGLHHLQKEVVESCVQKIEERKATNEKQSQEEGKVKNSQLSNIEMKIENLERDKRKNNLIIYNLIESEKNEAALRIAEDEKHIHKIFKQELHREDYGVERIIRLGRKTDGRRRPTLVEMRSERERMEILSNAKRLRNSSEYPRLYINKDLTLSERQKERELREALRIRRSRGDGEYIIKHGKIIVKNATRESIDRDNENVDRNDGERLGTDENNNEVVIRNDGVPQPEEGAVGGGARRKTGANFH